MADFLCPKCGSVDHLEGQAVPYPRQCAGCDEVFDRASLEGSESHTYAQPKRPAVRVELIRTNAWGRAKRRGAIPVRAKIWAGAALIVGLSGLYALFSWLGPMESIDQTGANVAASTRPAPRAELTEPAQPPKRNSADATPAAERDRAAAQVDADPASGKETADAAINPGNSATSEAQADEAAKMDDSRAAAGDRPAPSPDPPTGFARHIGLATPRYERVRMLSRPSWSGEEIEELSSVDMLLVLDAKPLHSWLHVMEIHSGAQGWVLESQVRVGSGAE